MHEIWPPQTLISLHLTYLFKFLKSKSKLSCRSLKLLTNNKTSLYSRLVQHQHESLISNGSDYSMKLEFVPLKPIFSAFDIFVQLLGIYFKLLCHSNHYLINKSNLYYRFVQNETFYF